MLAQISNRNRRARGTLRIVRVCDKSEHAPRDEERSELVRLFVIVRDPGPDEELVEGRLEKRRTVLGDRQRE